MNGHSHLALSILAVSLACACTPGQEADVAPERAVSEQSVSVSPQSDPEGVELALAVLDELGGRSAWEGTRFVRWKFFGGRLHYWDRQTGDIRIEFPERKNDQGEVERGEMLVLMNIHTREGRAWKDGSEIHDPEELKETLSRGHEVWVNDSYWMFMPYKLLDPGVTLKYLGERTMEDGRAAEVLDLTFGEGVGYTPNNRYEVYVGADSRRVEAWSFFAEASETEPAFTLPWTGWKRFGDIWLATDHGRGRNWEIAVPDEVPRSVFELPDPVEM
jgi:hypothetical protein